MPPVAGNDKIGLAGSSTGKDVIVGGIVLDDIRNGFFGVMMSAIRTKRFARAVMASVSHWNFSRRTPASSATMAGEMRRV
jgi:hypothetical protein